jgi:hypothetical protein
MFILQHNVTGEVFGPYATPKLPIIYRPMRDRDHWHPVHIGRRTAEQAMALGAAITSKKVTK